MSEPHKLPEGWSWRRFDEVAEIQSNLIDPASCRDALHIAPNHIESGTCQLLEYTTVAEDGVTSGKHSFHPGQILYSKIRPYLAKAVLVDFHGVCSADMYPVEAKIDPRYLMRWLACPEFVELVSREQGRTVLPKINQKGLNAMPVPVPPDGEDVRIAEKLEALTAKSRRAKDALDAIPPLLERFRQSVLAAAFRGDLTKDWREQHPDVEPADQLLARIRQERRTRWEQAEIVRLRAKGKAPKNGEWKKNYEEPQPADAERLPELPQGWCWAKSDELTALVTSGSRAWSKFYDRGTGTFIMAQNVRPNGLDFSTKQMVNPPADDPDRARSQVARGDVLITIVGANTGDVCTVDSDLPEHYVCQSVGLVRPVVASHGPYLARYLAATTHGRAQLDVFMYGQGRPHIGLDQLRSMTIPLPPAEEMHEVIAGIDRATERMTRVDAALRCASDSHHQLDASILAKAFRGELIPATDD